MLPGIFQISLHTCKFIPPPPPNPSPNPYPNSNPQPNPDTDSDPGPDPNPKADTDPDPDLNSGPNPVLTLSRVEFDSFQASCPHLAEVIVVMRQGAVEKETDQS